MYNKKKNSKGFTLIELMVAMIGSSILVLTLVTFTSSTVNDYTRLQAEGLARNKVTSGAFRISKVMRSLNHIESANQHTITAYSYFTINDQYTSRIVYYINTNEDQLLADVTPMTADYPIGELLTNEQRTIVIIDGFTKVSGSDTFEYFDKNHNLLTSPISDPAPIKNITINVYARKYQSNTDKYVTSKVTVNLRNKRIEL